MDFLAGLVDFALTAIGVLVVATVVGYAVGRGLADGIAHSGRLYIDTVVFDMGKEEK